MDAEQKQRAAQMLRRFSQANPRTLSADNAAVDMAALLHELIDAPEPEPVAYQVRNGWVNVAIYQRQIDAENYAKDQQKRHDLSGSLAHFCVVPLYTTPPSPTGYKVAAEPDWLDTTRFLTDVTTAAGLLGHGRQDKGLARRIGDFAHKYRMLAAAPAAQEPDQSEQHLEMVNAPAPSVPDSKTLQFLTDVLTAAGLLRHGKKDAGLAARIADESCRVRQQLFTQPEQPTDLVRDASPHPDDIAVDIFAKAMKAKMAKQRAKGYGGWQDKEKCPANRLRNLLIDHVTKGDPVDVGNFAMMLFNRGDSTAACKTCWGTGQCDDAYLGGIAYATWPCPDCVEAAERDKMKGGAA